MATTRIAIAILLCALVSSSGCKPETPEAYRQLAEDWAAVAERTPGFVVWESYRGDQWRIWYRNLDGSGLRSGVYLVRISNPSGEELSTMVTFVP